jgi:hypothetical protein
VVRYRIGDVVAELRSEDPRVSSTLLAGLRGRPAADKVVELE